MKAAGITPSTRQWIWSVKPGVLKIPEWARKATVRGLGQLEDRVWLWPVDVKKLVVQDRLAGGTPQVNVAEVRFCRVCCRPLIGTDAERRRLLDLSGPGGRQLPCGLSCTRDDGTGVWRKLVYGRSDRQDEAA